MNVTISAEKFSIRVADFILEIRKILLFSPTTVPPRTAVAACFVPIPNQLSTTSGSKASTSHLCAFELGEAAGFFDKRWSKVIVSGVLHPSIVSETAVLLFAHGRASNSGTTGAPALLSVIRGVVRVDDGEKHSPHR